MINYKYDFELYTLNELPTNDARLFLNIIVSNALTKAQAIQYGLLATNPPNFRQSV